MDVAADDLVAALRAEGLRITSARRAICEVLADRHHDHLDASALRVHAEEIAGRAIDPSTVYRAIDTLQAVGLVRHVHLGGGAAVLHLADDDGHHHMTCELCGRTVDVPATELLGALEPVALSHGFVAVTVHFAVVGLCADCATVRRAPS